MEYSLTEAAHATGLSRPTIFRAIKNGKLSARRLDDKSYRIDASELVRVYPLVSMKRDDATPRDAQKQAETAVTPGASETELALLRLKVQMLEEQMTRERELRGQEREAQDREREISRDTITDLRKRLDDEQAERRNLQLLLAPPAREKLQDAPSGSTAAVEPSRPSRSLLSRLWGR
jgi:excisionase family DNA binding protein